MRWFLYYEYYSIRTAHLRNLSLSYLWLSFCYCIFQLKCTPDSYDNRPVSQFLIIDDLLSPNIPQSPLLLEHVRESIIRSDLPSVDW